MKRAPRAAPASTAKVRSAPALDALENGATLPSAPAPPTTWTTGSPEASPTSTEAAARPLLRTPISTPKVSPASGLPSPSPRSWNTSSVSRTNAPAARAVRRNASSFSSASGTMRLGAGQKPSLDEPISGSQENVPCTPKS